MADKVDVLDLLDRAQSAMDYTQAAREAAQSCGVLPGDFRQARAAVDELIEAAKFAREVLAELGAPTRGQQQEMAARFDNALASLAGAP